MPPEDRLVAFALTAAIVIAIPGPSVLFIVGRALSGGKRAALLSVVGNTLGEYAQVVAIAFGLGVLAERSVALLTAVKVLGGLYLVYLGVRTYLARGQDSTALADAAAARLEGRRALLRGAFVGATNVKTVVFLAAILPQFTSPATGHLTLQVLLLGLVFSIIALVSDSIWALAADGVRSWFTGSPRRLALLEGAGGIAIAGLGVAVLASGSTD